jgi:hypothetical protein
MEQLLIMLSLNGRNSRWRTRKDMELIELFSTLIFLNIVGVKYLVDLILCIICGLMLLVWIIIKLRCNLLLLNKIVLLVLNK